MAAADSAAAGTWVTEDKRRMLHVVYRVGDMQVSGWFLVNYRGGGGGSRPATQRS